MKRILLSQKQDRGLLEISAPVAKKEIKNSVKGRSRRKHFDLLKVRRWLKKGPS